MRIVIALVLVLATARPAAACYPAFFRAIVGAPAFEPADAVTVTSETVDVQCDERFTCTVTSTFGIAVMKRARVSVTSTDTTELALATAGRSPAQSIEIEPADGQLILTARAELPMHLDSCVTDGVISRHPYFSSRPSNNERVLQIDTTSTPRVQHPMSWDLTVETREATKYYRATTRLWFEVPDRWFTLGGPVLLLGGASDAGRTLRLRAGWEVAIAKPWLVVGLFGDSDLGDTWNVALTAEPTTRAEPLISFGAGVGVVLANGTRVGGRGQLSIALGPARVMLAVDVVRGAAGNGADSSLAGFVGGSL